MKRRAQRRGEFDLIAKYFAPLARGETGALGLTDDAAYLSPAAGRDVVVTTDAIVEGVHFLPGDPPAAIAQKALRVNISDLAAKGAKPRAYMLTAILPSMIDDDWLAAFASGLKQDQKRFGLTLIGGDTVSTRGPLTLSITAIGEVACGRMVKRSGAQVGDDVWVSGSIGDAGLGLIQSTPQKLSLPTVHTSYLISRYQVPQPRLTLGLALVGLAHACIDVSDGLVADLGHICTASGVSILVNGADIPLSRAAAAALAAGEISLESLLTSGDDYELAFTAPASARTRLTGIAATLKIKIARIGRAGGGEGVSVLDDDSKPLHFDRRGFTHF